MCFCEYVCLWIMLNRAVGFSCVYIQLKREIEMGETQVILCPLKKKIDVLQILFEAFEDQQ